MFAILGRAVYSEDPRNTVAPESGDNSYAIIRRLLVQRSTAPLSLGTMRPRTHTFGT